jgi:periplasmic copper chaperone A
MSDTRLSCCLATVAATVLAVSPASAHITLKAKEATIGTPYDAVFVVPHGCAGSATTKIRVQIPEGVIAIKPMPTAGWNVETVTGKYAAAYAYQGSSVSEGAREVVWSGGKLPDHTREEFAISTFLTGGLKPDTVLYFPTVQECEQGVSRWIDIPADPAHAHDSKWPAPGVTLLPKP